VDASAVVSNTYAFWDANACDVKAANDVSWAIWHEVVSPTLAANPTISYVVVVGNDLQIPFHRVPDAAAIANESTYLASAHVKLASPLGAALLRGSILTDDLYGDKLPARWKGRYLYVPDVAVGRLLETPEEILEQIAAYRSEPTLVASTALATAYDFLTDSGDAIVQTMVDQGLAPATLVSEDWNADDLRLQWVGTRQDIASVNGHFEHWRTQPAMDTGSPPIFYNVNVANATVSLTGTVNHSMGCHGGLNVPDENRKPGIGHPDYPQVFGRKAAVWIANTGYGYGMDDAIAGSEQVYHYFQQALGSANQVAVGEALRQAKQRYVSELGTGGLGVYEEKSLIEATLYGMPMYVVDLPATVPLREAAQRERVSLGGQVSTAALNQIAVPLTFNPTLNQTAYGQYYDIDGEVQANSGRPIQPRTSTILKDVPSNHEIHGAIVWEANFETKPNFDPHITRPVTDVTLPEPGFSYAGWYPNQFWSFNALGNETALVVIAGQYRSRTEHVGTERVFRSLNLQVFTSSGTDLTPPAIHQVEADGLEKTFTVIAQVSDEDSGVKQVWVTYENTTGHWTSVPLNYVAATNLWQGAVTSALDTFSYFVQAVDNAGNTAASSNKGVYFDAAPELVHLPVIFLNAQP
jgi:hypothetical protein